MFYTEIDNTLYDSIHFNHSVQSLSHVQLFATRWTAARQTPLSFTISQSLLKLMSIESMMPSNHLILCHPLLLLPSLFPSIRIFSNESALHIGGQSIGASALASVLPMNSQGWFPLRLLIWSPLCPRDSEESSPTPQWSNSHIHTWLLEKPLLWLDGPLLAKWCLYLWLIHVEVWQKTTKFCKAIILQ